MQKSLLSGCNCQGASGSASDSPVCWESCGTTGDWGDEGHQRASPPWGHLCLFTGAKALLSGNSQLGEEGNQMPYFQDAFQTS